MMKLFPASLLASALVAAPLFAQDKPALPPVDNPDSAQTPTFRAETTLVQVPTLVRDKSGHPVYTLTAKDFTVTDNGVEQPVTLEEGNDGQPVALVIVVETGSSGALKMDLYPELEPMIEAVTGDVEHTVAVVGFDSHVYLEQPFTPNWSDVAAAMHSLQPGDDGAAIFDGVSYAVDQLRTQPPKYRRVILLLSETNDHGSEAGLVETVRAISDTNTIVYSVAFSSIRSDFKRKAPLIVQDDRPGPPHGCMGKYPDDSGQKNPNRLVQFWNCLGLLAPPLKAAQLVVQLGIDGLKRNVPESIAGMTGGEFFKFSNEKNLQKDLAAITNHVPNRYLLSFRPQSPAPGPHALEVKLKEYPKLEVTARRAYWVEPTVPAPQTPAPQAP
ncbi:VWA domain-containing protein [Silvibacterium sp.]|uniref:VWA domain-containing protein n=1 Tax=Silvibacterium sp. TaxID=1964179 RepID=UPI0039E585A7